MVVTVERVEIVRILADVNVGDLRAFHFNPQWKAKNGEPGRGCDQNGKGGDDCHHKGPTGYSSSQ